MFIRLYQTSLLLDMQCIFMGEHKGQYLRTQAKESNITFYALLVEKTS
jgi:hypothetical protein